MRRPGACEGFPSEGPPAPRAHCRIAELNKCMFPSSVICVCVWSSNGGCGHAFKREARTIIELSCSRPRPVRHHRHPPLAWNSKTVRSTSRPLPLPPPPPPPIRQPPRRNPRAGPIAKATAVARATHMRMPGAALAFGPGRKDMHARRAVPWRGTCKCTPAARHSTARFFVSLDAIFHFPYEPDKTLV